MDEDWAEQVLGFWFEELQPADWFRKSEALDARIKARFLALYQQLAGGDVGLAGGAREVLAAVIVLDQFPRNMFRGSAKSFASDGEALALAERAIGAGLDLELAPEERSFLYMPFQHSEDAGVQARSVELFARLGNENNLDYARRHQQIIARFGRFPHRNAVLGRASTPEELEFLKQPGSSF